MNPRERPGQRGMVWPPSWHGDEFTPAQEAEHERLREAEGQRAPADEPCTHCYGTGVVNLTWVSPYEPRRSAVCWPCRGRGTL